MSMELKYRRYAEKIRIFRGLNPHMLDYGAGQTIFHQGMLGSNLFIVFNGEVDIYNRNQLIAKCTAGDAFGEMSVLNQRPRSATAVAATEVKLFTLDESQINQILEKHASVRLLLNIINVLSERLEIANTHVAELKREKQD